MTEKSTCVNRRLGFLGLPAELRNKIYELLVVLDQPIDPRTPFWSRRISFPLLLVSRNAHREAVSLLYGQNIFDLGITATFGPPTRFLRQIGSRNAGYIRHVMIDFPDFSCLEVNSIALTKESMALLEMLRKRCTNLSTITTSLGSTNNMEILFSFLQNDQVASEALNFVSLQFEAISSLPKIILEVSEHSPKEGVVRELVKSYGWVIRINKLDERWKRDRVEAKNINVAATTTEAGYR